MSFSRNVDIFGHMGKTRLFQNDDIYGVMDNKRFFFFKLSQITCFTPECWYLGWYGQKLFFQKWSQKTGFSPNVDIYEYGKKIIFFKMISRNLVFVEMLVFLDIWLFPNDQNEILIFTD